MRMRHLVLMLLKASPNGKIISKTKLQKEMYFLSLLMKKDFGFKAHYFGPYSPYVEGGTDELVGAGFVDMKRESFGITNRGFEVRRYDFSITESGAKLASYLAKENPNEYRTIENLVGKIGNTDYLNLSIAAKTYFILNKQGSSMTTEEISLKARNFDWNIGSGDIEAAVEILRKLNLVKTGE